MIMTKNLLWTATRNNKIIDIISSEKLREKMSKSVDLEQLS